MRTVIAFSTAIRAAKSPPESSLQPTPTTMGQQQRSPWHSPVPYLFGGLAAMLCLIAFALLILACSYWKLSSRLEDREGGEGDLESGDDEKGDGSNKPVKVFEEKILVIMAGNENPTFLATPVSVCSKAATFGGGDEKVVDGQGMSKDGENEEISEKVKEEMGSHDHEEPENIRNQDDVSETQPRRLQEEVQHENQ
ncbi:protein GLUTAMINE DUMPER 5-like [Pyrus ussuriensis x Pyrus communis]|uniref:Protein GLUTAMINE DUMPER 5-like n=1 Tax=Pyrus ussuriensis x Pyrus communis TaxID=2448454 RepID=A0A5N5HK09_9ROSA|nr:protein GLUTAMINE DUMPER 5-like [Pyrus ussuriensis x Pyrus communis]